MEVKQLRFKGFVEDAQTGQPLKGVKVCTGSNIQGKLSTEKGKFVVKVDFDQDESQIKFTYPGYKSFKKMISTSSPRELKVAMVKDKENKELDDHSLIKAALNGSQKAFGILMNRYKDSVYYVILKMVNNHDDAEDLTIEAFGKAFHKLDKFSPDFAFSTWLFRIAINNSIDFIRKKRLETLSIDQPFGGSDDDSGLTPTITSEAPDPEERFIKDQRKQLMREITEKLSPKYRRLIELRFFDEMSYIEIAEQMELPIGTVKAQLFRAKQLLHNILKNSKGI